MRRQLDKDDGGIRVRNPQHHNINRLATKRETPLAQPPPPVQEDRKEVECKKENETFFCNKK